MAVKLKAPVIEIHTGAWCDAVVDGHAGKAEAEWQRIVAAVKLARAAGLEVHAGHSLDFVTAETIATLPEIAELNVGYFMISEALFVGLPATGCGPCGSRWSGAGADRSHASRPLAALE
jgi:pyridoxine 5-phosphate synthase